MQHKHTFSTIRIATRQSPLALWQANHVSHLIRKHLGLDSILVPLVTRGDEIQDRPLADVGGKGLFIKKLEEALILGQADIAVHSMKDVPSVLESDFCLPAFLARASVMDVLIPKQAGQTLATLPNQAKIGTSSFRRQSQLKAFRPDLDCRCLRGNVATRLKKLETEDLDAIILAEAGLDRLEVELPEASLISLDICLSSPGQGALGIECLKNRLDLIEIIRHLNDPKVASAVMAERAFAASLKGDCHSPIAAYATLHENQLILKGRVLSPDGSQVLEAELRGSPLHPEVLGQELAAILFAQGAQAILDVQYDTVRKQLKF